MSENLTLKQINKHREITVKLIIDEIDFLYNKENFETAEDFYEAVNAKIKSEFLFEE